MRAHPPTTDARRGARPTSAPGLVAPLPHLRRDWAHPGRICTGTGLTLATSAPGSTGLTPATSAWRLGSPRPHLHRDWDVLRHRIRWSVACSDSIRRLPHLRLQPPAFARTHTHTHARTHARTHTHTHTHTHTRADAHTHRRTNTRTHSRTRNHPGRSPRCELYRIRRLPAALHPHSLLARSMAPNPSPPTLKPTKPLNP